MIYLKQSTASQEVLLGPFVDSTDGNTAETGLTIANTDIKIWVAGATTLANKNSGGATHISAGNYYAVLDATDTATLGSGTMIVQVSGALAVRHDFCVLAANVYDSIIGGGDLLDVSTTQFNGSNVTASSGRPEVNTTHIAGSSVSTSTAQLGVNVVNFGGSAGTFASGIPAVNATQLSGDSTAADNAEAFFDGTGYAGTNNVIPTVTAVTGLTAATVHADLDDIQTRLPAALVSGRMDSSVGAMAANVLTATAINADAITAAKLHADVTTELQSGLATASAVSTLQTSVDDLPTNAELATSQAAADDATLAAIAALTIPTAGAIADAVWDEAIAGHAGAGSTGEALSDAGGAGTPPTAIEVADAVLTRQLDDPTPGSGTRDLLNAARFIRNGFSISGSTLTVLQEDDTTPAYTRTLTTDAGAVPIVGVD
jgi:hypothetical protein